MVGVLLSGALDDGSAGLRAIADCGGLALVQDPDEAARPDMPLSALAAVQPYRVARARDIGRAIGELAGEPAVLGETCPPELRTEAEFAERVLAAEGDMPEVGTLTSFSCPECGGPLWEAGKGAGTHFRCFTGHSYSPRTLAQSQASAIEQALWTALRTLDERRRLLVRLARESEQRGHRTASRYWERVKELEVQCRTVRRALEQV